MIIKNIKLIYVALLLMLPNIIYAQVTTSTLTGNVSSGGKPLIGATVRTIHEPSGTSFSTVSKGDGNYLIPNMRVGGPYRVEVSYVGFKNGVVDDIFLKLGEAYVLNVALKETSSTLTDVVVTGVNRNSVLNANRTGSVTNISTRQIATLPTVTRSLNDFIRITPQATSTNNGAIAGGNYRQNYITVDGSDFNNTFGIGTNLPAGGSPISIDAVGEISINVAPYDVKQSGFIGSAVNAVTRSGTNQFSGSVYFFGRTENQQGIKVAHNTPFARQNLEVEQYGVRFGGPIIKNKLFFFVNAEKGSTVSPGQLNVAARPGAPFGSSPNVSRPTAGFLDTVSNLLRTRYGYETGAYEGYDNIAENTRLLGRIDWNINKRHRMNIRYSQVESNSPSFVSTSRSPLATITPNRQSNNALWFKNTNYYQEANFYSLAAEVNSTFGKFANTFRGSFTHQNDPRSSDSKIFPFVDILSGGSPITSFGYEPFTFGNLRDVKSTSFVDYVTWTTGKHNWTAGAQIDFQSTKNGFQRFGTSYYTFRSWDDFVNGVKPVDFAITYSLSPNYEQAFPKFKFAQYSVYGQDEINLTDRLKVTGGLRLDLPKYPSVPEIKTHPLVANLTFADGEKLNTGVLPKERILWSPRLGFNWDVKGDRSLQVRGGTGVFTGRVPTVWIVAQSGDAGLLQFTQVFETPTANRNNPALFTTPGPFNPDPNAYLPTTPPAAGTAIPSTISAIDPDFKFPQTWKSSLAVDRKLPWGLVGTIEAVYNKDLNIALGRNPNLVTPQPLNVAGYPDTRPIYPVSNNQKFINALTSGGQASATGTSAFNPVVLDNANKGYYWSVTARVEKQLTKGFYGMIAYTKSQSKVIYDGTGDQLLNTWSLTPIVMNSNNPELSYANYVVPDRIVAMLSYRREYLKHLATTVSVFLEGSIGGRFSYVYGTNGTGSTGDLNRDGQANDLIYVPNDPTEIAFEDFSFAGVLYTAKQQSDLFFRYIEQDRYLSSRRGQYAERNGAKLPWRNQMDLKIAQDIFSNVGKYRNTIQLTLDIFNFSNMLNKNWGITRSINATAILAPTTASVNALTPGGTNKPVFRLAADRNNPVTATFRDNNSIASTYYLQFGVRYIFN